MLHPETNVQHPPASPKRQEGEFVVFEEVAFFKEHTNRDGVRIDRAALERICHRCNERIRDTGDFPPVVLRHTTDEGDRDPEVVGFAGAFHLGSVGNLRPKGAIFGTMWIFAEDAARVKKYPRLSVEYWASEDDPTNGYFDPISLLGAETPELDLGIRYSRGRKGKRPLRYARVERFSAKRVAVKESSLAIAGKAESLGRNEEAAQVPELESTLPSDEREHDFSSADEAVATTRSETPDATEELPPEEADDMDTDIESSDEAVEQPETTLGAADIQAIVEAIKPVIHAAVQEILERQLDFVHEEREEEDEGNVGDDAQDEVVHDNGAMTNDKASERESLFEESEHDDEVVDEEGSTPELSLFDPDAIDSDAQDVEAVASDMEGRFDFAGNPRGNDADVRAEDLARRPPVLIAGQRFSVGERPGTDEMENMRAEKRRAVRLQKLSELQLQGCALDVEDEVDESFDLDDAAFEKHCRRIATKYQRVPLGYVRQPRPESLDDPQAAAKRARYVKQASENVLKAREQGLHVDFKDELERLTSEHGAT